MVTSPWEATRRRRCSEHNKEVVESLVLTSIESNLLLRSFGPDGLSLRLLGAVLADAHVLNRIRVLSQRPLHTCGSFLPT